MAKIIIEVTQLVSGTGIYPLGENEKLATIVATKLEEVYRSTLEDGIKAAVDSIGLGAADN